MENNSEQLRSFYFPHDIGASNDPKLIYLRMIFGWKAIGIYWAIIEAMHKEKDGYIAVEIIEMMIRDFYLQEASRTKTNLNESEIKHFLEVLYSDANALLVVCERKATTLRVQKNLLERKIKSEKAKSSAEARWNKEVKKHINQDDLATMRTHSERYATPHANAMLKRKEKKRKEKYILSSKLDETYSYENQLKKMFEDKSDRRMPIIAYYWTIKGWKFENKLLYDSALKRELKPAALLTGYSNDKIKNTCTWLKENADFKWTIETIHKYIDEPLENLKQGGKQKSEDDLIKELKQKYVKS